MKKKILCIAIALPLTLLIAFSTMAYTHGVSNHAVEKTERVIALSKDGEWERAQEIMEELFSFWEEKERILQTWVCHQDGDAVREALLLARSALENRRLPELMEYSVVLRDALDHLHHRDDIKMANIL